MIDPTVTNNKGVENAEKNLEQAKGTARVDVLSAKISAWERYKGFMEVYNKSQSLKGLARLKFDKENRTTLDAMPKEYERF